MEALTRMITDAVSAGGGWALAAVMFAENIFPPIPSEAILPLAGYLVSQGTMSFLVAITLSTLGSVTGAWVLYAIGRWGGRPVLYRWHRVLRVNEAQLDRADAWFDKRGPKLVFWCRMIPLARSIVSVPAGASEMPIVSFTLLTTVGSLIWNTLLVTAGLLLGRNWERVASIAGTYSDVVVYGAAVVVVVGGVVLVVRSRSRDRSGRA